MCVCLMQVPQLLAVYNSQSAEGLALSSLYLEVRTSILSLSSSLGLPL